MNRARPALRLALVRQRYTPHGGAERFVARALTALKERGVQVTLVTRRWEPDASLDVIACDPFYLGSLWRDLGFARCACRKLAAAGVDLVQSHERIACCDIYRAGDGVHREWLAQRRRTLGPLQRLGLALNPYHHYVKAAEKRLFTSPRLRAVICNSEMVKQEIRRHFGVAEEKLHVIYSGVDTAVFHPDLKRHRCAMRDRHAIPQTATLFLFVGSGFERKGLAMALRALARLPADAQLLVIGKDKRAGSFEALARELGVARRVHFLGGQQEVKPYYGAADVLVLPTLYDPFPNVALEAMASGLPVVTSTKCGAAEFINNGENGFVCDALDESLLAESMRRLMQPMLRRDLATAARRTVEPYSLEAMSGRLIALYERLVVGD